MAVCCWRGSGLAGWAPVLLNCVGRHRACGQQQTKVGVSAAAQHTKNARRQSMAQMGKGAA
jgi:hypothetical protein